MRILTPLFLICLLGLLGTLAITQVLNWTGLSRLFWHPPLAFVALWVLASSQVSQLAGHTTMMLKARVRELQ